MSEPHKMMSCYGSTTLQNRILSPRSVTAKAPSPCCFDGKEKGALEGALIYCNMSQETRKAILSIILDIIHLRICISSGLGTAEGFSLNLSS